MQYQLGYEYYWNTTEKIEYNQKIISGAAINVLFSPKFDYEQLEGAPERRIGKNYLFEYFTPILNKDKKEFEFIPKYKELHHNITLEITDYFLYYEGEYRYILEPLKITREEFMKIFTIHSFIDLQNGGYFVVPVKG
ncbi:hypothetical protein [Faecalicoccus pleomorphus]|uniref:hypothetical protein n=1 Tax=Faecalicoccus pleomorphus TaxID=1323 RepID=UPI0026ED96F8|nr:hypothetical protein [Faecalicoccus pleomorphus]